MTPVVGPQELARMFAGAAEEVKRQCFVLSELDSAVGDGDHGTTMLRVAEQLNKAAAASEFSNLTTLLQDTGWRVLAVDGGASSSLLGTFILGMADALPHKNQLECGELAATFEAGLTVLSKHTAARPGDKTMMDALVPAIRAFRAGAATGLSIPETLRQAADAASAGAESTRDLPARYGRAKFLGQRALGHKDPGAASVALIFEGFSRSIAGEKEETGSA